MPNPVDFENLRQITGGDRDLERELFQNFLDSSVDCIEGLRTAMAGDDESSWRKKAHALKGVSLNLGALPLAELCKKAQDDYRAPAEDKKEVMAAIDAEFASVRAALEGALI